MEETDYELKDRHLKIKEGIEIIPDELFYECGLLSVELPNSLKIIGKKAFSYNRLTDVRIPDSVEYIGEKAFINNQSKSIKLNEGLKEIDMYAFYCNNLTSIEIPDSVEYIGYGAFDYDVEIKYKNHTLPKDFISKFWCENIIKASKILELVPNFNFDIIRREVINIIPIDDDSIKGYINNYKVFNNLCLFKNINWSEDFYCNEYEDLYKMCYILGLFNTVGGKQKEVIKVIKELFDIYNLDDIHQMFKYIELTKYKEKVAKIILSEYRHPKLKEIIAKLYNDYEVISKTIIKERKEQIGLLNHENNVSSSIEIEEQLNYLKSLKKEIIIDDIIKYIKENKKSN